jgi:thiosulfate dehydrogenase [quinone] large subunit
MVTTSATRDGDSRTTRTSNADHTADKQEQDMTTTMRTTTGSGTPTVGGAEIATTGDAEESRIQRAVPYVAAATRISLGWLFLWAFLDKAFALGHETGVDAKTGAIDYFGPAAWIHGGSPTAGFLGFATKGPLAGLYQNLAGNVVVDWVFMLGMLGIGVALILGIGMRIAAVSGAAMLILMWSAVLPPANNPFMDDHIVYALMLGLLALIGAGRTFGLGRAWEKIPFVADHGFLK